jgi:hypothetical protein
LNAAHSNAASIPTFWCVQAQDDIYFEPNCLTELPASVVPQNSVSFLNERIKFFTDTPAAEGGTTFVDGDRQCILFRQRCRLLNAQQHEALSPAEQALRLTASSQLLNVPNHDLYFGDTAALDSAGKPTGRSRTLPRPDPCPSKPYPTRCYLGLADTAQACTCSGGEVGPEGVATAGQPRDFACPEKVVSLGLHNYIIFMTETASLLAVDSTDTLSEPNVNYRKLIDFHQAEWEMGLLKSTVVYQHEIIEVLASSRLLSSIGFCINLLVIIVQYYIFAGQIGQLSSLRDRVSGVVERLIRRVQTDAGPGLQGASAARKNSVPDTSGAVQ